MAKTYKIDIRLDADEMREIERQARALGVPKSQLARAVLTGAAAPKQPAAAATDTDARLTKIEDAMAASAAAFEQLLSQLAEVVRVPTFREYRARAGAENIAKRTDEDDLRFFVRLAFLYHGLYQRWPDPADPRGFGPVPAGFNLASFPARPPA